MNRQIDFKSFIIGILITVCIVLAMGAGFSSSSSGRFQLAVRDNHAYVIDTANGRVWERFAPASQGRTSKNFHAEKISPDATDQD